MSEPNITDFEWAFVTDANVITAAARFNGVLFQTNLPVTFDGDAAIRAALIKAWHQTQKSQFKFK